MSEATGGARPAIPAEIRRRVLVEAGHRCAIPTCRYIETEIHHIRPWKETADHSYENLIALCANCHRRADRGEIDRKALRAYKFNLRLAHDKFSQLEIDLLFELYPMPAGQGLPWMPFMLIFFKRLIDAGYLRIYSRNGLLIGGVESAPSFVFLTDEGREFVVDLGHLLDE